MKNKKNTPTRAFALRITLAVAVLSIFSIVLAPSLANQRAKVDRLLLKTMANYSPKAQISGGAAAFFCQRVEDNAFHLRSGYKLDIQAPLRSA